MSEPRNLSADIVYEPDTNTWAASIAEHPWPGGDSRHVWRKRGMRTQHNAETAMEAAWQRLQKVKEDQADAKP